jgi:hypothetical protein
MLLLAASMLLSGASYGQSKMPTVKDFYGNWTVTDVVGYADMGGGVPHAKEMLGQILVISADGIGFGKELCKPNTGYRVIRVDTAKDLRTKSGASRKDAELPAKAVLLENDNCTEVYWLNSHEIEFDSMGVFLRAYRD